MADIAGVSTYLANKLLDHLTGNASYTAPTVYVAVSTSTPQEDGTGITEPSGNGYARVTTSAATWSAAADASITNGAAITFSTATGSWGTLTHVVLYDALTSGNFLGGAALDSSQAITTNQILSFAASGITITLT